MRSMANTMIRLLGLVALTALSQLAYSHGMSEAEKLSLVDGGNLSFMWLGATHMLSGFDHLLFVFGMVFFLTSFKDVVRYVTAFTLGHSVTLVYATFKGIQINYVAVDAVIGLSVCYIAFANLDGFRRVLKVPPPNMMAMVIGLGLVHGLGLSARLQQLPLDQDALLLNVIAFNVGVELGQVAALTVMLAAIALWRRRPSFEPFSLVANYGLVAAGALLFAMETHSLAHLEPQHAHADALNQGSSYSEERATAPDGRA